MKPAVPGMLRWLDARMLAFVPEEALPRFDEDRDGGPRRGRGAGRLRDREGGQVVVRDRALARVVSAAPRQVGHAATSAIALAFNQPVRAQRRREALRLRLRRAAASRRSSTTPARPTRRARGSRVLPHGPLALATKWRFECSAELTGAAGAAGPARPSAEGAPERARVRDLRTVQGQRRSAPRRRSIAPTRRRSPSTSRTPSMRHHAGTLPFEDQAGDRRVSRSAPRSSTTASAFSCAALQPNTRYTITVDGALVDRFGQRLPGQHVAEFGTGDGTPRLDIETGAWVVEASRPRVSRVGTQPHQLEVDVAAVPEASSASCRASSTGGTRAPSTLTKVGLETEHVTIPVKGRKNHWTADRRSSRPSCSAASGAPAGFYYLALRAPEEPAPEPAERGRHRRASCCSTSPTWA